MKTVIEAAVKELTKKVDSNVKAADAMHYTQAILNLTQALATLANTDKHLK